MHKLTQTLARGGGDTHDGEKIKKINAVYFVPNMAIFTLSLFKHGLRTINEAIKEKDYLRFEGLIKLLIDFFLKLQ